jgi:hypothetical protein
VNTCGDRLDDCRCGGFSTTPRTAAQLKALHRQAVRRAHASGFAADREARLWAAEVLLPGTVAAAIGRRAA